MAFGVGGQWRQTETRAEDGAVPILFDPSFRDAMQGGGRWKRFVRVEETSDGVVVSADTLLLRLWNTLWGKGYQYSTEQLQHIQKLKTDDAGTSEPFKLFCNHVVLSQIRSENLDQKAVHEAMQLLFGLKFLSNFSQFIGSSIEEVSYSFAEAIREKDVDLSKIAVVKLKAQLKKSEWIEELGCNPRLMKLMLEECTSLQEVDLVVRHLMACQYPLQAPAEYKIPYTIHILEEMLDLKVLGFEKSLREYLYSSQFANVVVAFQDRVTLCPEPLTDLQRLFVFDILFRAYEGLDMYSNETTLSVLIIASQFDQGEIEKIKEMKMLQTKLASYSEFTDFVSVFLASCATLRL